MKLSDAVYSRRSIKVYDRQHTIANDVLERIFLQARQAPSSFNLQHTKYVLVRDLERRQALRAAAWGQRHLEEASVSVIVCGDLDAHKQAARANGHAPEEVLENLVPMIDGFYEGNEQACRDEAIRSGGLAGMTLMLAAQAEGLATCPMIGFDPAKVAEICAIDDRHVPVMIVVIGKAAGDPFPTSRYPLAELVRCETLDGEGFAK